MDTPDLEPDLYDRWKVVRDWRAELEEEEEEEEYER